VILQEKTYFGYSNKLQRSPQRSDLTEDCQAYTSQKNFW